MVRLAGKTEYRSDRKENMPNYNTRPTAGGVCIHMSNVYSKIIQDYEILTLVTMDILLLFVYTNRRKAKLRPVLNF